MRYLSGVAAANRYPLRRLLPAWDEIRAALRRALCLSDPWVPAFVGLDEV